MNKQDCFQLGKFTKPFRYSGEVILWMDVDDKKPYAETKVVWVEEKKHLVPYMIEKLKSHKDRYVAKVSGIETEEAARTLCGKDVYLPVSDLPDLDNKTFYFHEVPGWTAVNLSTGDEIGQIVQVLDHGPYPLLEVDLNGTEVLLPLPQNFKVEVDRKEEKLLIEIPEGLVEVFENPGENDED